LEGGVRGKLILINSVLSSIPFYMFSMYLIPVWVIKTIDKIRAKFLWHGADNDKKRHLLVGNKSACLKIMGIWG
jgi:hypothetical protein